MKAACAVSGSSRRRHATGRCRRGRRSCLSRRTAPASRWHPSRSRLGPGPRRATRGARRARRRRGPGDSVGVEIRQLEELDVLLEAFRHRELVGELVVALDRLASRRLARHGGRHPRPCDVLEDAVRLPFRVARSQATLAEAGSLLDGHLVVGHHDRLSMTTILAIQPHHGVRRCSRSSEKVEHDCVWLVFDEEANRILDSIQRLRKGKPACRPEQRPQNPCSRPAARHGT